MIRPEHLRPLGLPGDAPAAPGDNRFEAKVLRARMVGATVSAHLNAAGTPLRVTLLNRSGFTPASLEGRTLTWAVSPAETVLLPKGEA